jgi:hypothetical protein
MTWEERLFSFLDDLEQQAEAAYDAERDLDLADRSRTEYAQVTLASRLMASVEEDVALEVRGVGQVHGTLCRVGEGWCLVRGSGQDWIVRTEAVTLVRGASERSVPEVAWSPVARLGLGSALRRIADSREPCVVHRIDGRHHDVVITRVGQDFVEAAGADAKPLLFPFGSLAAVQSRG